MRLASFFMLFALTSLTVGGVCLGQSAENVLLVANEDSPVSLEIAGYYAQKRGIPEENLMRIKCPASEEISRTDFARLIEGPIAMRLSRNSAQDRILYIVLTKGTPLRIQGTSGQRGTVSSVDSELTLLYRKMLGVQVRPEGWIGNPYYLAGGSIPEALQFSHETYDIYLVSRLDGYTSADVRGLIDRGCAPSNQGRILLDKKGGGAEKGENWLQSAAAWLQANGFSRRTVLDNSAKVLTGRNEVLGYCSWGSNDPAIRIRHFGLHFVPGALAAMFVSSDGRSFEEPPAGWKIGTWEDKSSYFAGSPQSLAGDLIRDGVTGVAAHVSEPFLEATIRPEILFPAYVSGFNLIESYYLAMPFLSWQTVVIGDPLCAPFRTVSLSTRQIDAGIDRETELPEFFSRRSVRLKAVAAFKQRGIPPEITKTLMRAEVRLAKEDYAGARRFLEEATAAHDRLPSAELTLASIYEQDEDYDKAIERYRKVVKLMPDNALALNNLAYALAVHGNDLQEALPMAEKAYSLAKKSPNVADTLAWICHLNGNDQKADGLLRAAVQDAPENAEIHLHLAMVAAAQGDSTRASVELAKALELDSKFDTREEVRQLREKLNPQLKQ